MSFINRSKLPPSAFCCVVDGCGAVSGGCEHTDPKLNPGFEVEVCGILRATHQPMNEIIVMGPVTPKPMTRPVGAIFSQETEE